MMIFITNAIKSDDITRQFGKHDDYFSATFGFGRHNFGRLVEQVRTDKLYGDIIDPAGFWPLSQNPRRHYRNPCIIENMYGITRKNLESQKQGPQRIRG